MTNNSNDETDEIRFDVSTNGSPLRLTITGAGEDAAATGDLDILADVTGLDLRIIGNGASQTIIDGNSLDHVFQIIAGGTLNETNVEMEGLRIQGGMTVAANSNGDGSANSNTIGGACPLRFTPRWRFRYRELQLLRWLSLILMGLWLAFCCLSDGTSASADLLIFRELSNREHAWHAGNLAHVIFGPEHAATLTAA